MFPFFRRLSAPLAALPIVVLATLAHAAEPLRGLIDPPALKARLGQTSLVVIDVRSGETKEQGRATFLAGHIPGAVHADYAHASWRLPRNNISVYLPEPAQFEALAGDLGVANESNVVIVHEGTDATSFGSAARVYWSFKAMGHASIAILDGGYQAWQKAGFPVETKPVQPVAAIYEAKPVPALRAKLEDVLAAKDKNVTLVDSRPETFFSGQEKHKALSTGGHIPGAINLPHHTAFGPDFRLKDKVSLAKAFAPAKTGDAAIAYCNTGHWAATDWFVLSEVLNQPNVKLYDGSMLEYTLEQKGPIATSRPRSGS
jgi:thiosulfate/3-mercaptopyruvate sulfurtransferase